MAASGHTLDDQSQRFSKCCCVFSNVNPMLSWQHEKFPMFAEFKFSSRKTDRFHYLKAYLFPDFLPAGDICRKPLNKMFAIHFAILVTLLNSWLEVRRISSGHFLFYALY